MKHNIKIIGIITILFLLAQFTGLYISHIYFTKELPYDIQKPQFETKSSFVNIFSAVIIATLFAIVLIKFKAERLWRFWFFISVCFSLLISLSAFMRQEFALVIALIITFFKTIKHNIIVHNLSEIFIYGGLAAIFSQSLSIFSVSILLILISIYDMIAVWQTKHMVKLAKFQTKLNLFAGILIPYKYKKEEKTALLGGGDIGFPLLFASAVLKSYGLKSLIIPIITSVFLVMLFIFGKNNKFYPAMPFLSIGCFFGYMLVLLF